MKRILYILMAVAVLASCSKHEDPDTLPEGGTRTSMTVRVTDGGYAASNPSTAQTRAMENDYVTEFTTGDKIGLYVVKTDGSYAHENVALTLTDNGDGTLAWTPPADTKLYYEGARAKYYTYYPYQSGLPGGVNPSATNAAGFFANVVSAWPLATDQSTHALYTASDLMIGEGTLGDKSNGVYPLTFAMNHAMALVVIETPTTKYTLTNKEGQTLPDYYLPAPGTQFYGFTPYNPTIGTYRYLVKPDQSGAPALYGSYLAANGNTKEYAIAQNDIAAANYAHSKVDGGFIEQTHTLQAGDFYLKDGSLLSESVTPSEAQKAACIGIVYWVGDATAKDKTLKEDHPGCTHGLVVALGDGGTVVWQNPSRSVQDWLDINKSDEFLAVQAGTEKNDPLNNIQGYNNTKAIEAFNADATNSGNLVAVVQKAVDYRSTVPAPGNSSNWYLPSAKELTLLCGTETEDIWSYNSGTANRDFINGKLQLIGGTAMLTSPSHWSSSEDYGRQGSTIAFYVHFVEGYVGSGGKSSAAWVRPVLAF